jgi:uncharacterized protein (TIGR03086 family)
MANVLDLGPAAGCLADLLGHVDEERLAAPTPCGGLSVAGVLDHVDGLARAFAAAAAKDLGPMTATPPVPDGRRLSAGWREEIPPRLAALASAWTRPAAWQGMTQVGGVDLPGEIAGRIALNEVVLHGWDLARGAGLPYQQDDTTLRACLDSLSLMYPAEEVDRRQGIFAAPVAVADDARLVDRVVAFSGRDPGWRPGA